VIPPLRLTAPLPQGESLARGDSDGYVLEVQGGPVLPCSVRDMMALLAEQQVCRRRPPWADGIDGPRGGIGMLAGCPACMFASILDERRAAINPRASARAFLM
jgi:hypothetical protein